VPPTALEQPLGNYPAIHMMVESVGNAFYVHIINSGRKVCRIHMQVRSISGCLPIVSIHGSDLTGSTSGSQHGRDIKSRDLNKNCSRNKVVLV
jgi:hypothetical protein